MSKGKKSRFDMTHAKFARFLEERRGQGAGASYRPWIQINDLSSKGRVHRTASDLTGFRTHHLLSDNELFAYVNAWWRPEVIDIREQYPLLPVELTVGIAAELGVKHPKNHREKFFIPQTTDLLIVTRNGLEPATVKEDKDYADKRVLEKLSIEEEFWRRRGIQRTVLLSSQLKTRCSLNLLWIYHGRREPEEKPYARGESPLYDCLVNGAARGRTSSRELASRTDAALGLYLGTSLAAIRRLLAERVLSTDVDKGDISKECDIWVGRNPR